MQDPDGGWWGRMHCDGRLEKDSPRGCILNARILWTFSCAYRLCARKDYLSAADRSRKYILAHIIDHEYGGAFWSLNPDGSPLETKKQFYAIAFVIYGLAEYARATGSAPSEAIELFRCIEKRSRDRAKGGYIEALARDWTPLEDMRLSDKDQGDAKTMNTHLHILEAYTALCRVWPADEMKEALRSLLEVFLDRIVRPDDHLGLFFTEDWTPTCAMASYGHDIEASWLLCEAAEVLGDAPLAERTRSIATRIATASLEGLSRIQFREMASNGLIPGVKKASW